MGTVLTAYLVGIALGNLPAFGLQSVAVSPSVATPVTGLSIFFAIPFFLVTTDFRAWLKQSRQAVRAYGLACGVVVVVAFSLAVVSGLPQAAEVAGMMTGAATGGAVNLAAVGYAVGAEPSLLVVVNTADTAIGGLFLLFLMRVAKPLLSRWLAPYPAQRTELGVGALLRSSALGPVQQGLRVAGVAVVLVAGSYALALGAMAIAKALGLPPTLVSELELPLVVVFLTPLSVLASLSPTVRSWRVAERMGDYTILVFALSFGSLVDVQALRTENLEVLALGAGTVVASVTVFYLLCRPMKVDVDTAIIMSCAAIMSPPFISAVAEAIGNRRVILTGLTTGIVGYAIGTFLGIGVTLALRLVN
jgi:uncharacterized membrane protein